jgi:hypothetical protein
MRNLQDKVTMALESYSRYEMMPIDEEYKATFDKVCLSESTKILTESVLSELTARDIVTRMAMLAQKERRGLKAADLQRVIAASLRGENFANGDAKAIEQETNALVSNAGVTQSVQHELKKMGIGFYY